MTATERVSCSNLSRARTFSHWQARPIPEAMIVSAFELACLGPTSANCQPLRLVLVRSPRQRAATALRSSGNYEKVERRRLRHRRV